MALSSVIAAENFPNRRVIVPSRGFEPRVGQPQSAATMGENRRRGHELLEAIKNTQLHHQNPAVDLGALPSTASELAESAPMLSDPVFEALYDRLGRWTGRHGSPEARQEVLRDWVRIGENAAFWLVGRVVEESNLDALDGASLALEAMGVVAAPYIIAALAASTSRGDADTALKLFRILEWFPAKDVAASAPSLAAIVEQWAFQRLVELREAAYRCLPLLPNGEDVRIRALRVETDPDLRDDLLQQRNS
jgi:hypothetical protein